MFAKALARIENKFINRIAAQQRRLQRVGEFLLAKQRQHGVRDRFVAALVVGAQFLPQFQRARVKAGRQLQRAPLHITVAAGAGADAVGQVRFHLVTPAAGDGGLRHQLIVRRDRRARRQRAWHVERKQPAPVMRLDRDAVTYRFRATLQEDAVNQRAHRRGPCAAVEIQQHRAAPVELVGQGNSAGKFGAQRYLLRKHQFVDTARAHAVRQAGDAGESVGGHAPQRPLHPRKQHKKYHHQRRRLRQHHGGGSQLMTRLRARVRRRVCVVQADHRGGDEPHAGQQVNRRRNRLRIKEIGNHQKITDKRQHHAVAVTAGFQQFEGEHQHQQRDACVAAKQGAVVQKDRRRACRDDADQQPARGQRQPGACKIHAPQAHRARDRA